MKKSFIVVLLVVSIVGFTCGLLTAVLPCRVCKVIVLELGTHKILGEHRLYCPQGDR